MLYYIIIGHSVENAHVMEIHKYQNAKGKEIAGRILGDDPAV